MEALTPVWRPRDSIRAIALGVPFRDARILVSAVTEDDGTVKGWRPLGGGIDFGETAEAAVIRELREELQAEAEVVTRLGIFENIYAHQGQTGHEIVFAYQVRLVKPGLAAADTFIIEDSGFRDRVAWVPLADFTAGRETLLPEGLLPLVPTLRDA